MKKNYVFRLWLFALLLFGAGELSAQSFTISGSVMDKASNEPIIGASLVLKGTTKGTVTDMEGKFTLQLDQAGILVVSFAGYKGKEISVDANSGLLSITLNEDVLNLDEVVVTGLASSVKRSNLANSVATVSAQELVGTTTQSTLDGALYGKLTGVDITQASGAPGGGIAMRLRGISSITGNNQPLFIVDGVYISNASIPSGSRFASGANAANEENSSNRIADLDPNDIESIEVLKGASAAAIYGTRANAGVVIITTKRGKAGGTKISFSQDLGFNTIIRKVGRRSYTEDQVRDAFGDAEAEKFRQAVATGRLFNYEDELYGEQGFITESRLSVTGGNDKTRFYIGGSLRDEDGIIKNTGFTRRSLRTNIDHKVSDRLTIRSSSNYVNSDAARSFTGNENDGGLSYGYNLAFTRDWVDLFPDAFGNYPDNPNAAGNMLLVRDIARNDETNNRFIQGFGADFVLLSNEKTMLQLRFNGGLDYLLSETNVYVPEFHQAQRGGQNGFIALGKNEVFNLNYQSFAVWDNYINDGQILLSTQAGVSYLNFKRDFVQTRTTQLIPGQTNATQGGAQQVVQTTGSEEEFGIIFQQEFNYDDKIIATAGLRLDKSSLNGDPNKYFAFPKASLAANIANFDFWSIPAINQFKLRAAYGETGSSAQFGSLFTTLNVTGIDGNSGTVINNAQGNARLEPETSRELEIGTDVSFLDGKFGVELSYYNRKVLNLLFERATPTSSGFSSQFSNDADLVNRGIEVALRGRFIESPNFVWTSTTNFWFNRNEVSRLGVPPFAAPGTAFGLSLGTYFIEEGQPITQFKGVGEEGPVTVGDAQADFQVSFFNQINFLKNFDFSFLLHWKQGGDNLNLTRLLTDIGGTTPRDIEPLANPQYFIEDASYVRLREIALYYNLPKPDFMRITGWKVGVSARNLFTITDYTSYDPETSTKGTQGLSTAVEVTPFPSAKQFYFHFKVDF